MPVKRPPSERSKPKGPTLNDEQKARKAHLLSRFSIFAKETGLVPDYAAQPHDEMCDQLEACMPRVRISSQQKKQLYMAPRGSFKTSIESAWFIYCIFWYEEHGIDIAMLYVRASIERSREVLFEIRMALQINETILELWGDVSTRAKAWNEEQINLSGRRDPTLMVGGLTVGMAGKHPDIIVADDLVDETNFDSIKVRRQTEKKVDSFKPVLPPWGTLILSGTFWDPNDVYSTQIKKDAARERERERLLKAGMTKEAATKLPEWRKYIRSAYNQDGTLFFPSRLNDAYLESQRASIEPKMFSAWYLMRSDVEGMVYFREEYLRYFSCNYHPPIGALGIPVLEVLHENGRSELIPVTVSATVDPTLTAGGHSDYTGVVFNAVDCDANWWILLARRYMKLPSDMGDEIVKLLCMFDPDICRIESAMADVEMVARIQQGITENSLRTMLQSYNPNRDETDSGTRGSRRPNRRKKSARIEALEPRFRNGKIRLQRGYACAALIDQYRDWSQNPDHDDVLDALSMQLGVARPCRYATVQEAEIDFGLDVDDEPEDEWAAYGVGNGKLATAGKVGLCSQRLAV